MIATLCLAAILLAQEPGPVDALLSRHQDAIRRAKTFDELTAVAKNTLAELAKLLDTKLDPESAARARAISCDICADLGDFDAAEAHARKFLDSWPKHPKAPLMKMTLGEVRTAGGRDAAARSAYQALIQEHPNDELVFDARLRIAQSFTCEGRDDEALKALAEIRASSKGKPEEWMAVMQMSLAHQIAGKPGDGRALLEEVVRSCPEAPIVEVAKRILVNWLWIGKTAPPAEGKNLKDEAVKLDPAGGKVTVLYFLGTAYPKFAVEAGVMRRLAGRFAPADFALLGVALDKEKSKLEPDLALAGVTWPVLFDGDGFKGPVASTFRVDDLPMVFVLDRKNVIRYVNPIFGDHGRDIGRCVQKLIAEK
jgi:tetratricopeptide (TPR) repeat protein